MRTYVIFVLYNTELLKSAGLLTILKLKLGELKIIVCDNCDNGMNIQNSEDAKQFSNLLYINMNGNKGISKAYNKAIQLVDDHSINACFYLFDQDTTIDESIIKHNSKILMQNSHINIIAPLVHDSVGLLSPCKVTAFGGRRFKRMDVNHKNISIINSGLCIRGNVFHQLRYDENLFLDFVDHTFMYDYKKQNNLQSLLVSELVLHQDFSGSSKTTISNKIKRFKIYIKDYRIFYRTRMKSYRIISDISLLLYSIKLCITYKSFAFIQLLLKELF